MAGNAPGSPSSPHQQRIDAAWFLYNADKFDSSIAKCLEGLAVEPQCSELHGLMALNLAWLSRFDEAIESARESIRLAPDWGWAHFAMGRVLRRACRWRDAEPYLRESLRLTPQSLLFREHLGWILLELDRNEEALALADEARRLDPSWAYAAGQRGLALQSLGRFEDAERAYQEALELDPGLDVAHCGLGYLALRRREGPKAAEAFQTALRRSPSYRYAEAGLGDAVRLLFPGYGRIQDIATWLRARSELQRNLLAWSFCIAWFGALIALPFVGTRTSPLLSVLLVLFIYGATWAWAFAFWALRPLYELGLKFHPVGKWFVVSDRVREGVIVASFLVPGVLLVPAGLAFEWPWGLTAGLACLLAVPSVGAQFRTPRPPRWGEEQLFLVVSLLIGLTPGAAGDFRYATIGLLVLGFQLLYTVCLSFTRP